MECEEQVRQFIVDNFLFGDDEGLSNEGSLSQNGIVDSTGILELVMFVEETFSISVEDHELIPEHFDSVVNISRYIYQKQLVLDKKIA